MTKTNNKRTLLLVLIVCALTAAVYKPLLFPRRHPHSNPGRNCSHRLKQVGFAMEAYSIDNLGRYTSDVELLRTKLEVTPKCPWDDAPYKITTGQGAYNSPGFQDYYFLECTSESDHDVGFPTGYPQYDSIEGFLGPR